MTGPLLDDEGWLRAAVQLSEVCPPSHTAFSVGCVIVSDGSPVAEGYSRQHHPHEHAEEAALDGVAPGDPRLAGATMYTSLEPCGARASRPRPCAELIIAAGIGRVVFAWAEPPLFVAASGAQRLRAAGVTVVEIPELAEAARAANQHLST